MAAILELTQAEYARRKGVTPKAIEKAITAGRIPSSAVRRAGRGKLIDVAAADLALKVSVSRINTPPAAPLIDSPPAAASSPAEPAPAPALTQARTETAQYDARLRQLEFEQKVGEVLKADDVRRSMERCAEAIGGALDQLAGRADDLATAFTRGGVDGVRRLLKQISRDVRGTIAANMRLLSEADAEAVEVDDENPAAPPAAAAEAPEDQAA